MTIIQAIILGIVEGITEFLPISSTGHLIVTAHLLQIPTTEFLKTFEIVIQLGALMALLGFCIRKVRAQKDMILYTVIAFLPTAVIGLLLYSFIKKFLGSIVIVAISLIIGGVIFIVVEYIHARRQDMWGTSQNMDQVTPLRAVSLGFIQSLALIPGVSRSGATIIGGLLMGMSRVSIVEFSFLLAFPTIAAATGLELLKTKAIFDSWSVMILIVGFVTAWISAHYSVSFLLKTIQRSSFVPYGWYRIALGCIILCLYLSGMIL